MRARRRTPIGTVRALGCPLSDGTAADPAEGPAREPRFNGPQAVGLQARHHAAEPGGYGDGSQEVAFQVAQAGRAREGHQEDDAPHGPQGPPDEGPARPDDALVDHLDRDTARDPEAPAPRPGLHASLRGAKTRAGGLEPAARPQADGLCGADDTGVLAVTLFAPRQPESSRHATERWARARMSS